MARWRAVPTAVSTAVGALAFLASTGLAVVLGAGLHVWSGPSTPAGVTGSDGQGPSSVTGRVGGVVTIAPPTAAPGPPHTASTAPTPTTVLPFIPFAPPTPAVAPAAASTEAPVAEPVAPTAAPTVAGDESPVVLHRRGAAAGPLVGERTLLARLSNVRVTSEHLDALRPHSSEQHLPHGITAGDGHGRDHADRARHGHRHGHRHHRGHHRGHHEAHHDGHRGHRHH